MTPIRSCKLPQGALLEKYRQGGAYADCYCTDVPGQPTHAEFVEAFYTTAVFKVERLLLAWLVSKPSSDDEARRLANGTLDSFAAWTVEGRSTNQLLLTDFRGRTRSWLMASTSTSSEAATTRLYFGSAVVPTRKASAGRAGLGFAFHALMGFHKLYSRVLLRAATARLGRSRSS